MFKEDTKKVMIIGFCSITENNNKRTFDYCGCTYPEGLQSSSQISLFDHDQIENVCYLGFINEEEKLFKERLKIFINEIFQS